MGVPYLNIHYQLMQSDLSAPKYTICLFLSYIFLCSHTWRSAILVVSGAHLAALVTLQSAKDAFPSSPDFSGFKSANLYNVSTLKCNALTPFYTGVCVFFFFFQSSKGRICLRGIVSKSEPLFQKPRHDKIMFCNCKRILVKVHSHENHF